MDPIPHTIPCGDLVRIFSQEKGPAFVPVSDGRSICTIIRRELFLAAFARQYAWSLLNGRPLSQWMALQKAVHPPVTIQARTDVATAAVVLNERPEAEGVLVLLDQETYAGIVTHESVMAGMLQALSDARNAALSASEAKTMFLANMSHEIRTPLNGIIGFTEILLEDERDPVAKEIIELIHGSGKNLLTLINSILDVSRLETGMLTLESTLFDVSATVTEVIALLSIIAHKKGLDLHLTIQPQVPPHIYGDPIRLRQVLINLIGNALKFTTSGFVHVTVERKTDGNIEFSVVDSGPGMNRTALRHLFQPFMQGDNTASRGFEGSGLGLAISQRLTNLMGGCLKVESQEGQGSRFSFDIPITSKHR